MDFEIGCGFFVAFQNGTACMRAVRSDATWLSTLR